MSQPPSSSGPPPRADDAPADLGAPPEPPAADPLHDSLDPREVPDPTESMRLAGQAQQGDAAALEALLRRYEDRLRRVVRIRLSARLRGCLESVDIVQETWRAAVTHLRDLQIHEPAAILQWLARIAENHMVDAYRHFHAARRDRRREVPLAGDRDGSRGGGGFDPPAQEPGPAEAASRAELMRIVDEAVAELPEDYREVIVLRTYNGGSWEFVARTMGNPSVEASRQLHRRARIRLGRMLRERLPKTLSDPDGE